MKPLLDIESLSVDFRTKKGAVRAIREVSLSIRKGETVCLVGESGSGKTVTSKAVMRLIDRENGVIAGGRLLLDDKDLTELPESELRKLRGKKMAMVFQEPMAAFDPVFTIGYQIEETIMRHERKSRKAARAYAAELLQRVGITEPELRLKQYPGELSGGMLQRAMIAMALSCGPDLLIADEPTTALDVTIQAQILKLLRELKDSLGMGMLLITHDLGIAAEIADRVVVMYAGEIVEEASAAELFASPQHPYTRGLLQSVATLDTVRGTKLHAIKGAIPSLSALPEGCSFHPRCPHATERCTTDNPPLVVQGERRVACWNVEAIAAFQPAETEPEVRGSGERKLTIATPAVTAAEEQQQQRQEQQQQQQQQQQEQKGAADELLFEVEGLRKYYPLKGGGIVRARSYIHAVDNVSFGIHRKETFGLVGESGSGKSTLGRVLLQMERATSGQIRFQGQDLTGLKGSQLRQARKDMQVIFQDPYGSLDPRWKIGDSIAEPLRVHGSMSAAERKGRVEELLSLVGLDPSWAERHPHEFSGGQRQRIGIARAIALNPSFILADEAVSALDVSVQAQIVNLLQELQEKLGLTYLFIAHGLQVVRHISDRIGVMYLGELVEIAPSDELFQAPAHPYTRALIASIPQVGAGTRNDFSAIEGEIPSPANPPAGCRFHTRCPMATARCREEKPELRLLGDRHYAACHYPL